jgi:hypothetical protein
MDETPKYRVEKNGDGKPLFVELLDDNGDVVTKEVYDYDAAGNAARRCSFDKNGALLECESWLRDDGGRLLEHSLTRADGTPVYREQWNRDATGKLIFAESRSYNESGRQTGYRKLNADSEGHIVRGESFKTVAIRALCLLVGGACLVAAMHQWHVGNFPMAMLSLGVACLNFWNGVKKR